MSEKPIIVWFRHDLRLDDHPAFAAAAQTGSPIIPLYIWSPEEEGEWRPGAASCWWLHHSLLSLQQELEKLGLSLIIRQHASLATLVDIASQTGAKDIYWNRCYEPSLVQRDASYQALLPQHQLKARTFLGNVLFEPWSVYNKQGKPFQVFTSFWKRCQQLDSPAVPLAKPLHLRKWKGQIGSLSLSDLHLLPTQGWDAGLFQNWQPGSLGAQERLELALEEVIETYSQRRDFPSLPGTSKLSPHLHFGELSPRTIWHAVQRRFGVGLEGQAFLRQLGWREFAYHLLYHFPHTSQDALRPAFNAFAWEKNPAHLQAWQRGKTGYPIVDAGMRQLWQTGWMHNRVRMIVASFLVKDLLIHWHEGAKWFWDTLVDADLANNTLGWQWIAGCGADAAPYFRIFNPILQGEKFDEEGLYVKQWLPELRLVPTRWIHCPWKAPIEVLKAAKVELGVDYPLPIVDHAKARDRALEAYAKIKSYA